MVVGPSQLFLNILLRTAPCMATGLLATAEEHEMLIPVPTRPHRRHLVTDITPSATLAAAATVMNHIGWSTFFSFQPPQARS